MPRTARAWRLLFDEHQFAAVLDCAGNCALKQCEVAPELAWRINVEGVRNLLTQTGPRGVRLVHLSCDLVFSGADGRGGYVETDPTDPVTVYGRRWWRAKKPFWRPTPSACILRISLPMGVSFSGHAGAIDWIVSRFKKSRPATLYFDEIRTPTYTDCLNRLCQRMLAGPWSGIFHAGARRWLSLYQIAQIINRVGGYDPGLPDGHPAQPGGADPAAGRQRVHGLWQVDRRLGLRSVRPLAVLRHASADTCRLASRASARRTAVTRPIAPRLGQQSEPADVAAPLGSCANDAARRVN